MNNHINISIDIKNEQTQRKGKSGAVSKTYYFIFGWLTICGAVLGKQNSQNIIVDNTTMAIGSSGCQYGSA